MAGSATPRPFDPSTTFGTGGVGDGLGSGRAALLGTGWAQDKLEVGMREAIRKPMYESRKARLARLKAEEAVRRRMVSPAAFSSFLRTGRIG